MKYLSLFKKQGLRYFFVAIYQKVRKKCFVWQQNRKFKGQPSFSQYAEDLYIDNLLGYKNRGFYVDVGANHPDVLSNTKRFFLRGWKGINIEPNLLNYRLFVERRPLDINLNIGISNISGSLIFYEFDPDTLSTFSEAVKNSLLEQGYKLLKQHPVPIYTLASIFKEQKVGQIDFLSVDTEGFDMQVLIGNNWKFYRPKIVCIEAGKISEFESFFSSVGYKKVGYNGLNLFFKDLNIL